ncbi:hypothetical protein SPRG_07149 [Saprolegnia parasitica CBS 223.65]|uniref:Uncharacterized protein n=1 Tax=Saprolegnia parasitica (strain CBS 223.65) TaxID=695850 RepID=A0A067CM26_SAPPC|nr:hypothetical protein SPRG_07149 [Saprolegnia parasitica CBS 223.65]KDO27877.1 hypothetical protein SPRG_07149 [Saprolegnia parasitica CBS 223.65]|eukprot:XP_012201334.1 hypothetical protein SPRG_07149 [Saprolegnia parasitica CBS 223.65]
MSDDAFTLTFSSLSFRPQYQRNNKKGGLKNLRCFPNCCSGIHAATGFCGGSVLVGASAAHVSHRGTIAVFAEFCPFVNGKPQGNARLHDVFTAEKIAALSNKDSDVHAPWYTGDVLQGSHDVGYIYSINTFKRGWHYGWTSNRHTANTQHVLCVYAFELNPATGRWHCICVAPSPTFMLYCRRRAKMRKDLTAPNGIDILDENDMEMEDDDDENDSGSSTPSLKKRTRDADLEPVPLLPYPTMLPNAMSDGPEFLLPPDSVVEIPELAAFLKHKLARFQ